MLRRHLPTAADSRVRRRSGVVFQELEGEAVLVHLDRGTCFTLDPIGTRIWQLIGDECDLDRIATVLTAEFDVARDVAERDLRGLIEELLARELVAIDDPSTA